MKNLVGRSMLVLFLARQAERCVGFTTAVPIQQRLLSSARNTEQTLFSSVLQYTNTSPSVSIILHSTANGNSAPVEEASVLSLSTDHEAIGESISRSVAAWLDAEWIPQEVHLKMGINVKATYIQCRENGIHEVGEIMIKVTDNLYERWDEYNSDAFVNAWDIGNYVSDYLIQKTGVEGCGCSEGIVE